MPLFRRPAEPAASTAPALTPPATSPERVHQESERDMSIGGQGRRDPMVDRLQQRIADLETHADGLHSTRGADVVDREHRGDDSGAPSVADLNNDLDVLHRQLEDAFRETDDRIAALERMASGAAARAEAAFARVSSAQAQASRSEERADEAVALTVELAATVEQLSEQLTSLGHDEEPSAESDAPDPRPIEVGPVTVSPPPADPAPASPAPPPAGIPYPSYGRREGDA